MITKNQFGVIYDNDGVLVDSNPAHYKSWKIAAASNGFDFTEKLFQETFGQTSLEIIANHWPSKPSEDEIRRIEEEKETLYRKLATEGEVHLIAGAIELIKQLTELEIPVGVGSSGPGINVHFILNQFGITPYLKSIVSGSDVVHGKPAPDIFLEVSRQFGIAPERCVIIDDSESGVLAGKAAGMKVVGFFSQGHLPYEYEKADLVVHSFNELSPEILADLVTYK